MSTITYNGVQLPYGFCTRFSQEAVYDDLSGTDWCYTKVEIETQVTLNPAYMGAYLPGFNAAGVPTNAAGLMDIVRGKLIQPRKQLSVTFNGVELIPKRQGSLSGTVDAKNGPQAPSCNIVQLTDQTFLLTWHCIAHYWEGHNVALNSDGTPQNLPEGNNVLWNRWSETQDIDNCNMSVRTREGKFVIRSDNASGFVPDQLRSQMAVVGVPQGFLRKSSSYTVTPDGLGLQYRIVDGECFKPPPPPAFEAAGDYSESLSKYGAFKFCECRVALKGDKRVDQSKLCQLALGIVTAKLAMQGSPAFGNPGQSETILDGGGISVNLYENRVEARLRIRRSVNSAGSTLVTGGALGLLGGNKARTYGIGGVNWTNLGKTPYPGFGDDPNSIPQPAYQDRGTAGFGAGAPGSIQQGGILLMAAAYYDPSLKNTVLDKTTGKLTNGQQPGTAGLFPET